MFPTEIWSIIIQYVSVIDLKKISKVCCLIDQYIRVYITPKKSMIIYMTRGLDDSYDLLRDNEHMIIEILGTYYFVSAKGIRSYGSSKVNRITINNEGYHDLENIKVHSIQNIAVNTVNKLAILSSMYSNYVCKYDTLRCPVGKLVLNDIEFEAQYLICKKNVVYSGTFPMAIMLKDNMAVFINNGANNVSFEEFRVVYTSNNDRY